jgi:hypothetical protein
MVLLIAAGAPPAGHRGMLGRGGGGGTEGAAGSAIDPGRTRLTGLADGT